MCASLSTDRTQPASLLLFPSHYLPTVLPMNFAVGARNALSKHIQSGSLTINLADGTSAPITGGVGVGSGGVGVDASGATACRVAHGALMLSAFALLLPAGALVARHKWVFGDRGTGAISPGWFWAHRGVSLLALLAALAGFILILVRFKWAGRAEAAGYYSWHRAVGMAAFYMMVVQVDGIRLDG